MSEKEAGRLIEHEELRDIHRRIDSLKEEGERNHKELTDKLHGLEVAVARGGRFPAGAWVAAAALVVSVLGTGGVLYNKLEQADEHASKALQLIEQHLQAAPVHRQRVDDMSVQWDEWRRVIPLCEERLKNLEGKVVGKGPDGWHRTDQNLYAEMVRAQMDAMNKRLDALEKRK